MLEEKIIELKRELVEEASIAESMVKSSITGLVEKRKELLERVLKEDEPKLNAADLKIEELCTGLIALFQPEASHLRTILMAFKINSDLERIGDLAVNIAQSSMFLIERPKIKPFIDLPILAEEAIYMLKSAIDSFIKRDTILARQICQKDTVVDRLRDKILEELIELMKKDPKTVERAVHLIRISRNLERIADLATNICEDVIYIVEGKVIKHHKEEKEEKKDTV